MKRYPAQIVFLQNPPGYSWTGRLLNPEAIDVHGYVPAVCHCRITQRNLKDESDGFDLMTQGAPKGSRRWSRHRTLTDAQNAAIAWAGRRFKVEIPSASDAEGQPKGV